jgi:succinyl-CoA synthetase beta subunit
MKLHEYQAKELLRKRGILTLDSQVCFTLDEALSATKHIGLPVVIKAQVHAGGRGKAGGIKLARTQDEVISYTQQILSMTIKNQQTSEQGQKVSCVLIEKAADIKKELYVAVLLDRQAEKICLIASSCGGMDIEEVAHKDPQSIKKVLIDPLMGLMPYQVRNLAIELDIDKKLQSKFVSIVMPMYRSFIDLDASLVEINPLGITSDDSIIAVDAKISIDDNAMYRQKLLAEMHDPSQEDEKEIEAQHHHLSYVALEGNIGCMVNGAGLAMATMDIIKHVGGKPANFLDVGGSATQSAVEEALKIIVKDKNVKAIFVNVFGGIAHCDVIARGVVNAAKAINLKLPLVVRLQGTNVEMGKAVLKESGLSIITADNMLDGAKYAVEKTRI